MCCKCSVRRGRMTWADWKRAYEKTCYITYNDGYIRVDFNHLMGKSDCFDLSDFAVSSAGGLWVHLIRRSR